MPPSATPSPRRRYGRWLFAAGLVFVAALTMGPAPSGALLAVGRRVLDVLGLDAGPLTGFHLVVAANVALFVPVGAALAWWRPRLSVWAVGAVGCVLSIGVELTQWAIATHRHPLVIDVITNTLGALIGAVLVRTATRAWRRRRAARPNASVGGGR